ncbi:hypothetical protein [Streptomyces aureocirculatus]|uniref:hypothetical protein n=1 Tax=Streptomyces aureocirculatus TaxID=67275 RepID=UPI0012FED4E1|nr:hypothetical protein [Streptomyces aureocirculatus]
MLQLEGEGSGVRQWPRDFHRKYRGVLPINEPGTLPNEPPNEPGTLPVDPHPPPDQDPQATPAPASPEPQAVPTPASSERQVADHLLDIAQGCGYDGRPAYRLPLVFPRFAAAYGAFYAWRPDQPPKSGSGTRAVQNDTLERLIKDAIRDAKRYALLELRKRVADLALGDDLLVNAQLGGFIGLCVRVIDAFRFPHLRTLRWYRNKALDSLPLPTNRALLQELRAWRDKPRAERELLLVQALLADIDAHYGFFRRLNRVRRPVILLPDVDCVPARRTIRDALLTAYDDDKSRRLRVHPVVITTSAPGAAPPSKGANCAAPASELAAAVPRLFRARDEAAERRCRGEDVPLPGRLLPVDLGDDADSADPAHPTPPGPRRGFGRVGPVTVTALSLAAMATAVYGVLLFFSPGGPESCGEGLRMAGRDCVGVSDGTGVYMPHVDGMSEVSAAIEAENNRIAKLKYATVALMIPMESESPAVQRQILSEVQGAYLAQRETNAPGSDTAAKPPIRLVLANPGRNYGQWQKTVDDLLKEPRLRVVAGFNLSLDTSLDAMTDLTRVRQVPVVASLVTSTDFANPETADRDKDPFPGLARVVSTAREQASALLQFDPELAGAQTALVADTRKKDNYNSSLRAAFAEAREGKKNETGVQDMTYVSPGLEEPGITPNKFEDFALNLCQSRARYVYFAGRAHHLEIFIKKLAGTYCAGKADGKGYTVITGSDATTLGGRLDQGERRLLRGDAGGGRPSVSVLYAAPAHPDAWDTEVDRWRERAVRDGRERTADRDRPRYLAEPQEALAKLRDSADAADIGEVSLDDGRTILTHDVILTAAKELTKSVQVGGAEVPTRERIREDLRSLNLAFRVRGASGWICLTGAGNPYNKAVSVVRLDPSVKKLRFQGVAWPTGSPPERNCEVPQRSGAE